MLNKTINLLADDLGTDFFGVADLSPHREAINNEYGGVAAGFPYAVSIGIALLNAIVDLLPRRLDDILVPVTYRHHAYDVVNDRLDAAASRLCSAIQRAGYQAFPIPASLTIDHEKLYGAFSHKMAAHLAGLGWIGKSCLLVTTTSGPRVRWATVLTDAPLDVTGGAIEQKCGSCRLCVEACPANAFSGEPFRMGEPRDTRFNVHLCDAYLNQIGYRQGDGACGMCLYVCPYGKKKLS